VTLLPPLEDDLDITTEIPVIETQYKQSDLFLVTPKQSIKTFPVYNRNDDSDPYKPWYQRRISWIILLIASIVLALVTALSQSDSVSVFEFGEPKIQSETAESDKPLASILEERSLESKISVSNNKPEQVAGPTIVSDLEEQLISETGTTADTAADDSVIAKETSTSNSAETNSTSKQADESNPKVPAVVTTDKPSEPNIPGEPTGPVSVNPVVPVVPVDSVVVPVEPVADIPVESEEGLIDESEIEQPQLGPTLEAGEEEAAPIEIFGIEFFEDIVPELDGPINLEAIQPADEQVPASQPGRRLGQQ